MPANLENSAVATVAIPFQMNCGPPGSSVGGILQARILQGIAISFSRGPSWPRDQTLVFCIAGRFFTIWTTGKIQPQRKALPKSVQTTTQWHSFHTLAK